MYIHVYRNYFFYSKQGTSSNKYLTDAEILDFFDNLSGSDLDDDFDDDIEEDALIYERNNTIDKHVPRTDFEQNVEDFDDNNEVVSHTNDSDNNILAVGVEGDETVITQNVDKDSYNCTEKSSISYRRGQEQFQKDAIEFITEDSPENDDVEHNPLFFFQKYFPEELFERAATYTNMYVQQKDVRSFKVTDSDEIQKLFGLHILMGSLKLPRIRLYWSSDVNIGLVTNTMSYERFSQLRNNFHFVDIQQEPANCTDKFYRVRPIIDSVRNRCLQHRVEEIVSIDEQIIPFKGRLAIKQYCKGKPYPWGIKNYVLAGKSGLPYDFVLYQGKASGISEQNIKRFGFGASVVLHLSDRLKHPGHQLYFDNFFSSYNLFEILRHNKINAAGTVRINRFVSPPLLNDKEMKKKG